MLQAVGEEGNPSGRSNVNVSMLTLPVPSPLFASLPVRCLFSASRQALMESVSLPVELLIFCWLTSCQSAKVADEVYRLLVVLSSILSSSPLSPPSLAVFPFSPSSNRLDPSPPSDPHVQVAVFYFCAKIIQLLLVLFLFLIVASDASRGTNQDETSRGFDVILPPSFPPSLPPSLSPSLPPSLPPSLSLERAVLSSLTAPQL
eukprot:754029-Hanusia_phi.AAC.3